MSIETTGAQGAKEFFRSPLRILAAILVSSLFLAGVYGQGNSANGGTHESERAAKARALNNSVLQLHGQLQENATGAPAIRSKAAIVLAQRAAALQALMQENAGAALSFAFSPELLADLADKFPGSAANLESHVTVNGALEVWTFDSADLKSSQTQYQVKFGQQSLTLHFASHAPDIAKGTEFQMTGVISGNHMAVAESRVTQPRLAPGFVFLRSAMDGLQKFVNALSATLVAAVWLLAAVILLAMFGTRASLRRLAIYAAAVTLVLSNPAIGAAQSSCSTIGVQNIAVILVNFPGAPLPNGVTTQSLNDTFFNTATGPSLDGYLRDASNGKTSASGAVFGPYTLTGTYGSCSDVTNGVLNDAVAAAIAGGANLSSYNRVFLVFPDVFGCGWAGFASNSCSISSSSGNFTASVAYMAASSVTARATGVSIASHELGHNFGLLHSGTVDNGTAALGPLSAPGNLTDMGDYWSSMGATVLGTYPASQKAEVLGWLGANANYVTVQSSGTYTLQPLEINPAGLQVLRVQRGTGNNAWLWIEYRQPIDNYDSTLIAQPFSGALIHYEDATTGSAHSYLPNFTPTDASGNSPALGAGQTWADPYSNVSVSVLSATSTGLSVSVTYGATPCSSAAPGVVVSPVDPSIYPGQSASYAVSVTNNDSTGCSASTVNLVSSEPAGWSTSFSSSAITLNPGQTVALNMSKGAPAGTPAGTYAVNLNAATNSANSTGAANATVMAAPTVAISLSVAGSSFSRPGTVPLTATVINGGAPISGASVTFAVTGPNGNKTTLSATTNASGIASANYKLNQRSAAGSYSVAAQAAISSGSRKNANTQAVASGPVYFVVQ